MDITKIALSLFIITNPIGNSPAIMSLVRDHTLTNQRKILLRESIFAGILACFFLFSGEIFLNYFNIQDYSLKICGGFLLFTVALGMIFVDRSEETIHQLKQEPFIVPIATPLLSGAGLLTTIMVYSKQESNDLKIFLAILIAWIGVIGVLVSMPHIQYYVGKRGMAAIEQLMGMLLAMMSMEMIVQGCSLFATLLASAK